MSGIRKINKGLSLKQVVEEYEKDIILECLKRWNGDRIKVALVLLVTRQGLNQKLKKYGIKVEGYE